MSQEYKRTEDQIVGQLPIEVTLGAKTYNITPLRIRPAVEWRKKLHAEMSKILSGFQSEVGGNPAEAISGGLVTALLHFPETLLDLLFAYAPELPRETIMEEATEEQVSAAMSRVMVVAYPFLATLATMTKVQATTSQSPQ